MKSGEFLHRIGHKIGYLTIVVAIIWSGLGYSPDAAAAGLLVADGGFGGVLQMKEHVVRVSINNGVAVTEVSQTFVNTESRIVEALYTFPVPAGASVSNFSMWIGGKEMVGEVVEKQRAREIYDSYKAKRRDPGLLEQVDYRTFEMRIYPIAPKAEQRVQITYYQELDPDNDQATYVYPLATATRSGVDNRVTGRFGINFSVRSEVPLTEMQSPSHGSGFVFTKHNDSFMQASLESTEGSLAQDVVVTYKLSRPQTGMDLVTSHHDGEDGYFCLTLMAGEELKGALSGMDYVFMMDVSGSMGTEGKLHTSTSAAAAFLKALGKDDRFELLSFNVQPTPLFNTLQAVDETNIKTASEFLAGQEARGGTVLKAAMDTAYRYVDPKGDRTLNVVLLSDGITEQGGDREELLRLIAARPKNIRVFCVGVGNEVNRPLLEQMADESGGLAMCISLSDDFERQAEAFRRKLTRPVATGLNIQLSGLETYDITPSRLPNLYHGAPVRLYGRYKGNGNVQANVTADVQGQPLNTTLTFDFPAVDADNPEIERMWAWHRIEELQRQIQRGGTPPDAAAEIVRLGEAYSIATEYTSFLVLENNAEYDRWKIERRNALRIEKDRGAQRKLADQLEKMRTEALSKIGPPQEPSESAQTSSSPASTASPAPISPMAQSPSTGRNQNISIMPRVGSGAIDPITGGCAALVAALAAIARRKKS